MGDVSELLDAASARDGWIMNGRDGYSACPVYLHVNRIMEGQINAAECIADAPSGAGLSADAFIQCVSTAWQNRQPFRAQAYGPTADGRFEWTMLLGRATLGGFECVALHTHGYGMPAALEVVSISLNPASPTFARGPDTRFAGQTREWIIPSCAPELIPRPTLTPADYDPPRVVPVGIVCSRPGADASSGTDATPSEMSAADGSSGDGGSVSDVTMIRQDSSSFDASGFGG